MGRLAEALKATIRLGGTGVPYTTPIGNDVVYASPWWDGTKHAGINVTADKALSYIPFFAGVRAISEDLASLPLHVYRDLPGGGKAKDTGHRLNPLLHDAPNPFMSSMTWRETIQAHVLTWGNGYSEIEYATDGSILGLWPLRPDRMEVLLEKGANRILYRYTLSDGRQIDLPSRQVFHVKGLGYDGLIGYSIISKAASALGVALAGDKQAGDSLSKGNVPPAVLRHPATLSEDARKNLRESWDAIDHRNRVAILEEGLDIKEIGVPAKDAQFIETMGMQRSLMATLLRMPPHMLGDVERSTSWGTGIEQQGIAYVVHTLRPWLVRWEQEGNRQLLRGDGRFLKHTVDGLLRGDSAARWSSYRTAVDLGVFTVNKVLELEDMNPISEEEGGNIRRAPLNMVPLDQWRDASLKERLEIVRTLTLAGFQPEAVADAVGVEPIEHTGLEPVTVSEQGAFSGNGAHAVPE